MADLDTIEEFDKFSSFRNKLRVMSAGVGEWAGIPMPIDGEELVIESSYPFADALSTKHESENEPGLRVRNMFYSWRWKCDIIIFERQGKIQCAKIPAFHGLKHQLQTIGASFAWGIEQEHNALKLLGTLVRHHTFKQYLLTGSFLETSKRSGLTYMFRKLRPTAVLHDKRGEMCVMCALCMHPIAYYAGSWGGAMCPTDDVIAHLMLMRADEPMLWRRSNQHPPHRPEAGL